MKQQWFCLSIVLLIAIVRADNSPSDLNEISLNGTVINPNTIDDESDNGSVNGTDQAPGGNTTTGNNETNTTPTEMDVVNVEENGPVDETKDEEPFQLVETEPYGAKDVPFEENFQKFLDEHPNEKTITSPGYPAPYPNETFVKCYEAIGGTGVDVTIHMLDIDPKRDYLRIRGGDVNDDKEQGPMLTGTLSKVLKFRFIHTHKFTVEFVPVINEEIPNVRKGFLITYSSQGDVIEPTTTTTTEPTVPAEKLEYISRQLEVRQEEQNDATWEKIRMVLSNSTNMYLGAHSLNMTYEPARPDRVIIVMVQRCPVTWPRSTDCVTIQFGVPLPPRQVETVGVRRTTTVEPPYELSEQRLEAMWTEFAVIELDQAGLGVYIITESSKVLAIWITISLSVIAAFILVLYSIWKIDFMKDYRRMSDSHDDGANTMKTNTMEPPPFSINDYPPPPQDGIDAFMRDYAPNDFNKAYEGTPYSGSGSNLGKGENPFAFDQGYTNNNFTQTILDPYDPSIMDFNDNASPIQDFNDGKARNNTYDELSVASSHSNNNHRLYGTNQISNSSNSDA